MFFSNNKIFISIVLLCFVSITISMRSPRAFKEAQTEEQKKAILQQEAEVAYTEGLKDFDEISRIIAAFDDSPATMLDGFSKWIEDLILTNPDQVIYDSLEEFKYTELKDLINDLIRGRIFARLLENQYSVQDASNIAHTLISQLFKTHEKSGEYDDLNSLYRINTDTAALRQLQIYKKDLYVSMRNADYSAESFTQSAKEIINSLYKQMCPLISQDHLLVPLDLNLGAACDLYWPSLLALEEQIAEIQRKARILYHFSSNFPKLLSNILKFILNKGHVAYVYHNNIRWLNIISRTQDIVKIISDARKEGNFFMDQDLLDLCRQVHEWKVELYYKESLFENSKYFPSLYHQFLLSALQIFRHTNGIAPAAEIAMLLIKDIIGQPPAELRPTLRADCLKEVINDIGTKSYKELEEYPTYYLLRYAYCYSAFDDATALTTDQQKFLAENFESFDSINQVVYYTFNHVRIIWEDLKVFDFIGEADKLKTLIHISTQYSSTNTIEFNTREEALRALDSFLIDQFQQISHTEESRNLTNFLFLLVKLFNYIQTSADFEMMKLPSFLEDKSFWTLANAELKKTRYNKLMAKIKERATELAKTRVAQPSQNSGIWDKIFSASNDPVDNFLATNKSPLIEDKWLSFVLKSTILGNHRQRILI